MRDKKERGNSSRIIWDDCSIAFSNFYFEIWLTLDFAHDNTRCNTLSSGRRGILVVSVNVLGMGIN